MVLTQNGFCCNHRYCNQGSRSQSPRIWHNKAKQRVPVAVLMNPIGSPTATSLRLTIFDLLLVQARGEVQASRRMPSKSRVVTMSDLQVALF